MSERDERWQARQDALALGESGAGWTEPVHHDGLDEPGALDDPRWREELDFYDALAEHATGDAAPSPLDDALIETALAAAETPSGAGSAARVGVVAAVVSLAAAALLWMAWPQQTLLHGAERSWTSEAQDVLDAIARRADSAEAARTSSSSSPEHALFPESEPEPEPEPEPESEPEHARQAPPPRTPRRPKADAASLVATARAARGDGRLGDAERSYGELLRRFPKSAEARAGRVALAQIKLGRGKARAALRLFTEAAGGGGPLAEEAAWGRIQALDRLGRKDGLRKAVDAFVRDYPTSVYRARAQGRLEP